MIKTIEQIAFISFLTVASWQDIKSRSVAVWVYGLFGSMAWFLNLCRAEKTDWRGLGCGMAICLFLLTVNRITEGAIGEGDAYFFAITGIFLGVWKNVLLFCGGVIFCGFCCMGIMVWNMGKCAAVKKKTVPFLPFLLPIGIWLAIV